MKKKQILLLLLCIAVIGGAIGLNQFLTIQKEKKHGIEGLTTEEQQMLYEQKKKSEQLMAERGIPPTDVSVEFLCADGFSWEALGYTVENINQLQTYDVLVADEYKKLTETMARDLLQEEFDGEHKIVDENAFAVSDIGDYVQYQNKDSKKSVGGSILYIYYYRDEDVKGEKKEDGRVMTQGYLDKYPCGIEGDGCSYEIIKVEDSTEMLSSCDEEYQIAYAISDIPITNKYYTPLNSDVEDISATSYAWGCQYAQSYFAYKNGELISGQWVTPKQITNPRKIKKQWNSLEEVTQEITRRLEAESTFGVYKCYEIQDATVVYAFAFGEKTKSGIREMIATPMLELECDEYFYKDEWSVNEGLCFVVNLENGYIFLGKN